LAQVIRRPRSERVSIRTKKIPKRNKHYNERRFKHLGSSERERKFSAVSIFDTAEITTPLSNSINQTLFNADFENSLATCGAGTGHSGLAIFQSRRGRIGDLTLSATF
jgi:hypothetical protein